MYIEFRGITVFVAIRVLSTVSPGTCMTAIVNKLSLFVNPRSDETTDSSSSLSNMTSGSQISASASLHGCSGVIVKIKYREPPTLGSHNRM